MLNLLFSLAGIFALIVIVGRLLHRYFIYIPDRTRVEPKNAGLQGVEEVVVLGRRGRVELPNPGQDQLGVVDGQVGGSQADQATALGTVG